MFDNINDEPTGLDDIFADFTDDTNSINIDIRDEKQSSKPLSENTDKDVKFDLTPKVEEDVKESDPVDKEDVFDEFLDDTGKNSEEDSTKETTTVITDPFENDVKTVNYLKEQGIISIEDDVEITAENASDFIEDGFDKRVDERIAEIAKDPVTKNFLKAVNNGVDAYSYMASIVKKDNSANLGQKFDPENSEHIERIVRDTMKSQGYKESIISSQITHMRDQGLLKEQAITFNEQAQAARVQAEKDLVAQSENSVKQAKEVERKYRNSVASELKKGETVLGRNLDISEQRELMSFMVDKDFEVANGNRVSESTVKLYEAMQNPKTAIIIAQLLKSDFDMSSLQKYYETQATKDVRDKSRGGEGKNKRYKKVGLDDLT